ncbi:MAG TPA: low molecular weight protein-tyrosine-phosphatase [Longimicrobiaceae bacterium]|nr:low molecular weight protein-tyrosine-phosphatase [Longimicrobiaceae bacterium]
MPSEPTRILFVCLGNICRSPLAESVFRHLARQRGVEDRFEVDSAGTSGYHVGAPPDRRSAATALARGIQVTGSSRKLTPADLRRFHYVVVMDSENLAEAEALHAATGGSARIHRLREWDPEPGSLDVPDPYYGGPRGFEQVHDIVERSCAALLDHLLRERGEA